MSGVEVSRPQPSAFSMDYLLEVEPHIRSSAPIPSGPEHRNSPLHHKEMAELQNLKVNTYYHPESYGAPPKYGAMDPPPMGISVVQSLNIAENDNYLPYSVGTIMPNLNTATPAVSELGHFAQNFHSPAYKPAGPPYPYNQDHEAANIPTTVKTESVKSDSSPPPRHAPAPGQGGGLTHRSIKQEFPQGRPPGYLPPYGHTPQGQLVGSYNAENGSYKWLPGSTNGKLLFFEKSF